MEFRPGDRIEVQNVPGISASWNGRTGTYVRPEGDWAYIDLDEPFGTCHKNILMGDPSRYLKLLTTRSPLEQQIADYVRRELSNV